MKIASYIPLHIFPKSFHPTRPIKGISELECLAIVEALDYWHHYLYGKNFTVITDHQALQWLGKMKKPNSRLFKWSLKLGQYYFSIQYKPGRINVEADALSRSPVLEDYNHKKHPKIINQLTTCEKIPKNNSGIPLPKLYPEQIMKNQGKNPPPLYPEQNETNSGNPCRIFNHDHEKIINLLNKEEIYRAQTLEKEDGKILPLRKDPSGIATRKKGFSTKFTSLSP